MKISHRILLLILITILLISLANLFIARHQANLLHADSEKILAHTLVQSLRDALVQDVIDGNKLRVVNLLKRLKTHDNPIEFLYVTDTDHAIFAHSFDDGFPRYLLYKEKQSYSTQSGIQLTHKYQTENGLIFVYREDLIPGMDAQFHIGINQSEIATKLAQNTRNILIISLLTALVALLIAYIWARQITTPLTRFTEQVERFGSGKPADFSDQGNNTPEISQLATAFQAAISERQQALIKLNEREQDLAITLDSIGDAVITTDAKGLVTRMNPVAEKMTGWSLEEAKHQPLKTIFPIINATTRETIKNPVDKVMSTGNTVFLSNHTTLISKDGTEYQIADSAAPIRNGNNDIQGMVLIFNDVTEQYHMREEIRLSEQHLKLYREQAPLASIEWNLDFQVIGWNNAAEKIFGYTFDEVKGRDFVDLMLPENAVVDIKKIWQDLISQAGGDVSINENLTKEGHIILCEWHNTALKDETGKVIGAASIVQDITERKQQEEKIRRSQKMDALGKLTGGIAHDYNNMLGVILGYSELLKNMLNDKPVISDYINEIHRAGERGAKLTKKLLTFARQKASDAKILDINALLKDQQHMLEKTLTARIKLVFDLSDDLWQVCLDNNDLEDAVINMSINAMHAIENNGQITIRTSNEVINKTDAQLLQIKAGEYVLLSLTDTGSGMDEATKEKIFDPFYSTKGDQGTGLGLSQVYGFIEHNNGSIQVFSEPGHGTQFALYFPRHYEVTEDKQQNKNKPAIDSNGSETILIVDDEPALAKLCSTILSQHGYHVFTANNGKEALVVLESESIDLVLSDVIMPEMDGYELATSIQEKYPRIKIQLASGFSDDRHLNMVDESLHRNILHKPYSSYTLLKRIHELLVE